MQDDEIQAVAAELAASREGKPSHPGATRKRVLYTPVSVQRAVRLFRQSGQTPTVFAQRLGVSSSALSRWVADSGDGAFIPIRAASGRAVRDAPVVITEAPDVPEVAHVAAPPPVATAVVVRETVVSIPPGLDLARIREIMMALRGGAPC